MIVKLIIHDEFTCFKQSSFSGTGKNIEPQNPALFRSAGDNGWSVPVTPL